MCIRDSLSAAELKDVTAAYILEVEMTAVIDGEEESAEEDIQMCIRDRYRIESGMTSAGVFKRCRRAGVENQPMTEIKILTVIEKAYAV